ncbi:MAG: relaxase/mobilization nuclease domain-containing protein [Bacteroidetes bacterium]|nr:relaxase/mobilization nuclease domain-containing protein [Bacteroidota bacterium]
MMTQLLDLLFQESGDPGQVKPVKNNARPLKVKKGQGGKSKKSSRDKASRVVAGSTEVMVKITGYGKGGAHAKAHLMYITRHAMSEKEKIAIENEKGQLFDNIEDVRQLYQDWCRDIDANTKPGKSKNQRDTMHMILSMPGKNDPLALRDAVRAFAANAFGANHEYVFALHTDTDNDHCHLSVKCRGLNGRQLHVPKGQVQRWREDFAERLRERGIDAEATARNVRGVVRKAENQVLRHIDDPEPVGRAPRQSRVMQSRLAEASQAIRAEAGGQEPDGKPWEGVVRSTQGRSKAAWLRAADDLEKRPTTLKTKNGKELSYERIDYTGIDRQRARDGQRRGAAVAGIDPGHGQAGATGVHQPGHRGVGGRRPSQSIPGLRDLPAGNVARGQGQGHAAGFLQPDARHRLDAGGTLSDSSVRRARTGPDADVGRMSLAERNQRLATQIRRFVSKMPEPVTSQESLRRKLRELVKSVQQPTPSPGGLQPGQVPSNGPRRDPGRER